MHGKDVWKCKRATQALRGSRQGAEGTPYLHPHLRSVTASTHGVLTEQDSAQAEADHS